MLKRVAKIVGWIGISSVAAVIAYRLGRIAGFREWAKADGDWEENDEGEDDDDDGVIDDDIDAEWEDEDESDDEWEEEYDNGDYDIYTDGNTGNDTGADGVAGDDTDKDKSYDAQGVGRKGRVGSEAYETERGDGSDDEKAITTVALYNDGALPAALALELSRNSMITIPAMMIRRLIPAVFQVKLLATWTEEECRQVATLISMMNAPEMEFAHENYLCFADDRDHNTMFYLSIMLEEDRDGMNGEAIVIGTEARPEDQAVYAGKSILLPFASMTAEEFKESRCPVMDREQRTDLEIIRYALKALA